MCVYLASLIYTAVQLDSLLDLLPRGSVHYSKPSPEDPRRWIPPFSLRFLQRGFMYFWRLAESGHVLIIWLICPLSLRLPTHTPIFMYSVNICPMRMLSASGTADESRGWADKNGTQRTHEDSGASGEKGKWGSKGQCGFVFELRATGPTVE